MSYAPGEQLLVRFGGIPLDGRAFLAARVSDGGGTIALASGARTLSNKCASQVYAPEMTNDGKPVEVLLTTPCDNAPEVITVSLVSSPSGHGPFYFTTGGVKRTAGRAPACPPPAPPARPPYPFQEPINETCPNGAAAQHNAPCPAVPCRSPVGKEGTCLVSFDQSEPDRNGSINAEARVELLTDDVTPISHHYVTGSAPPTRAWTRDISDWKLSIDGEVDQAHNFTMADLQSFPHVTRRYVLECAGNWGRGIVPAYQQADWWSIGAVGCSEWTGVLLKDVLDSVGVKSSAVYVAYYGEDNFLSRGVPIEKALDGHTMLAWAMNGEPLPAFHGFPVRMLAPGFPGAAQGKWLKRLWIRDREHDGLGMLGKSYRIPKYPLKPGDYKAPDEWFKVFTQQPVRSLIVRPPRCSVTPSPLVRLEGKAWSGAGDVTSVHLSYDSGATWIATRLSPPANKWAWQRWAANLTLPSPGAWNIFVRASDHTGATQPMLVPGWNPGGYGNNQVMKIDIQVLTSLEPSEHPRCNVCKHVYNPFRDCGGKENLARDCGEGGVPFEDLPASWHCPVCGAAKSQYHRIVAGGGSFEWVQRDAHSPDHPAKDMSLLGSLASPGDDDPRLNARTWNVATPLVMWSGWIVAGVAISLLLVQRRVRCDVERHDATPYVALH
mmetsp:Transcript_176029/g.559170  ORF Transcript_176029/g.559170 Transcript_176029/m.559170 type:complete len:663 (+) Transcript_176029:156-2144(+)